VKPGEYSAGATVAPGLEQVRLSRPMTQSRYPKAPASGVGRANTPERVLRLIEAVAEREDGIGVRGLALEIDIDRSAVSRMLRQLSALGALEAAGVPGRYVIGPRLYALASAVSARDHLLRAARPQLQDLVVTSRETAYLGVREGNEVVYRDVVECSQPVRYVAPLGRGSPLHAGAGGRAILAGLPRDEACSLLEASELGALTANTIVSLEELMVRIDADREQGFSFSVGERVATGAAVGAPFYDGFGTCVGSLVVAFPAERLSEHSIPELGLNVRQAADRLSSRLGMMSRRSVAS
jgi:IclR family acetate operon transcriptional repressor